MTDEHSDADRNSEPDRLVVGVSQADGETTPLELGFKVKNAEDLHAARGDGIFFTDYTDVAKA